MDLVKQLEKNPFVLAPMAGITDFPFRTFMKEMGCSVVITELVSANGIKYNSEKTKKLMRFEEVQRPFGVQLFGETPDAIAEAAKYAQDFGADFVDLNFGCPVKKVVKKGAGSAVLKDMNQLTQILKSVRASIDIPLTIKIRTGWDEETRNAPEVVKIAWNEGVTWVAIHGRTRAAAYSGKADWDYIAEVKKSSPIPILGNGDLTSAEMAVQRMKESGCDGVMIGRGCLKNPYIFKQAMHLWQSSDEGVERNYSEVIDRLLGHLSRFYDDRIIQIQLRKFSAWFSAGFPNSSVFRKELYSCNETAALAHLSRNYFSQVEVLPQLDTSGEAFLMGGHG